MTPWQRRGSRRDAANTEKAQPTPYIVALTLLARRELSESQIRQRLARRGYEDDAIDDAVARLKQNGSIDDERVAAAIARTETSLKRRGKLRVRRQIQSAGIRSETAARAIDATFADLDEDALLQAALQKRLRGRERAADNRELQRIYRFLVGQGFEADRISRALRSIRPTRNTR
jgi:regulatory protein